MKALSLALCAAATIGAGALMSAASAAPHQAGGTRLITLGTSAGPLSRVDRAQSSNLLIVNGALYLIDAGDGVTRRLVQAHQDFTKVGHVFITHDHDDHTGGLATLMSAAWQYNRREPIEIYGPPGTAKVVAGAIAFDAVNTEIRLSEGRQKPMEDIVAVHEIGVGPVFKDANVSVTAVENTHFQFAKGSPAYGKYRSYSYRFETPDKVIVFTGDTGPSPAVTKLATGADILVSEVLSPDEIKERMVKAGRWQKMTDHEKAGWSMHMHEEHLTPEAVGKMATEARVKAVVLTHLPSAGHDPDDYQRFAEATRKAYAGPVTVAKDLMSFEP